MQNNRLAVHIWDLPTRLFHWALVVCIVGAFVSVKLGGLYMDWHVRFGCTALGLILFRLLWGFIGPRYARFTHFVRGPAAVARYLKGAAAPAGHNPLGALSVLALLLVIGFQAVSGLFTTDDIMTQGPLFGHVSEAVSAAMTSWHKLNEWVILTLVALHIAAVLWYALVRRKRLVRAIITGKVDAKDVPAGTAPTQDGFAVWLRALVLGACVTVLVLWIRSLEVAADMSFS
ncbi:MULTISPECIES: cytochrome b/b6 domain-containing protein [Achromobacter]|uniref:Cytochrome B n=1 Tax=Alcaligenes xylosoxydans xylosoxydans TaxID=85698 RepID=A0A424WG24_ALCXX|nr:MULTISPECIES: cytochrome b/b6 domain-containing protein [Achromobacter]MBC9905426.1 cytochrome b/b6 domain-containing protein [Achromobacter xylosoxidans]MBD0869000.1 cytochrome b/b6 domain-containing protein [Achromobacter xylosoxidans]MDH1299513.1 cytochrome b/b6 domain-containing protein [Achromobacter sp. GD03932]QNP84179.1 cytochrome b/b6 domain-containing protein [Achromobacter xylosoxidans]RPJ92205.1 cytochrome B [Achromobacter xylosoxidans]